jgi:hypothetical protein
MDEANAVVFLSHGKNLQVLLQWFSAVVFPIPDLTRKLAAVWLHNGFPRDKRKR